MNSHDKGPQRQRQTTHRGSDNQIRRGSSCISTKDSGGCHLLCLTEHPVTNAYQNLTKAYDAYRQIKGDGHCGWRGQLLS